MKTIVMELAMVSHLLLKLSSKSFAFSLVHIMQRYILPMVVCCLALEVCDCWHAMKYKYIL